jgi:hypothetical protein
MYINTTAIRLSWCEDIVNQERGMDFQAEGCSDVDTTPNKCQVKALKPGLKNKHVRARAEALCILFCACATLDDFFTPLQWVYPAEGIKVAGAVLVVNDKPQGLMISDACIPETKTYDSAPVYYRLSHFRDAIISAAEGNVDNQ